MVISTVLLEICTCIHRFGRPNVSFQLVNLWLVGQLIQPGRKRRIGRLQQFIVGQPVVEGGEIVRAWRIRREKPDLIEREDSSAAQAEDAKFGVSQGFITEPAVQAETGKPAEAWTVCRRAKKRGDSRIGQSAALTELRFEATWKLTSQRRQRNEEPGQPGSSIRW